MASAQSSQDMWHGRGRQPQLLGNAQPRHRSESRRLSDRKRPMKTAARKRDRCPGSLCEGDAVQVFSRSADVWVDGEVVEFVGSTFVCVQYEVGVDLCCKTLHLHSDHLEIPAKRMGTHLTFIAGSSTMSDEQDPGCSSSTAEKGGPEMLYEAAREGDVGKIQTLLDSGCDPLTCLATTPLESSALHVAAAHGHSAALVELLDAADTLCRGKFTLDCHMNGMGESLLDIMRRNPKPDFKDIMAKFGCVVAENAAPQTVLQADAPVRIVGLQATPKLNGSTGIVKQWHGGNLRWEIQLDDHPSRRVGVKTANLQVIGKTFDQIPQCFSKGAGTVDELLHRPGAELVVKRHDMERINQGYLVDLFGERKVTLIRYEKLTRKWLVSIKEGWKSMVPESCLKQPQNSFTVSFERAVAFSPFIGNRLLPFKLAEFDVEDVVGGLEEEWRRFVGSPSESAYETWSSMRQDMLEDYAREVSSNGVDLFWSRRASVKEMGRRLRDAFLQTVHQNTKSQFPVFRAAIWIYTLHSFVYQAVNTAMRTEDEHRFGHLRGFISLLHHAVCYYAQDYPFKGPVFRVMHIDHSLLELYGGKDNGALDGLYSWSGLTSCTKMPEKAVDNLSIYGSSAPDRVNILFIIKPDYVDSTDPVFPADISRRSDPLAAWGSVEQEVVYRLGQQFEIVSQERLVSTKLPEYLGLDKTSVHATGDVYIVNVKAVDRFYDFADKIQRNGMTETRNKPRVMEILLARLAQERRLAARKSEARCLFALGQYLSSFQYSDSNDYVESIELMISYLSEASLIWDELPLDSENDGNNVRMLLSVASLKQAEVLHKNQGPKEDINRHLTLAFNIQKKYLLFCQQTWGVKHPFTARVLTDLGISFRRLGYPEKALPYILDALAINLQTGQSEADTAKSRLMLDDCKAAMSQGAHGAPIVGMLECRQGNCDVCMRLTKQGEWKPK